MSTFPGSPFLLKAGVVLLDPDTSQVTGIVNLQYNPETVTRSLQPQRIESSGTRSEALRLTGPPIETIRFSAELDATDKLEFPDDNPDAAENGIQSQLAALETLIYPSSADVQANHDAAQSGTLEIAPAEAPLALLVWSVNRVVPVQLTNFSITEQAFDPKLNPIRASVDLEFRVLSVNDLGFDHKGASLFMAYHQQKERLAEKGRGGTLRALGLGGIP
jgi:hypothetical protein